MHDAGPAENLRVIRNLMERAALYRRALAPVSFAAGTLGIAAAATGWIADLDTARSFASLWMAVALLGLGTALGIMRHQAVRDGEPFWSPPTRRVAQSMLPSLLAGALAGLVVALPAWRDPLHAWWLPGIWMLLFGNAAVAAATFLPSGFRRFGWLFVLLGAAAVFYVNSRSHAAGMPSLRLAHVVMGATFGGLHLLYGVYLALTEPRARAS